MSWDGYTARKDTLPGNWKTIAAYVKRRDRGICVQCGAEGRDVDHIGDRMDHSLSNLQLLCGDCHDRKTQAQAKAALIKKIEENKKKLRRSESHPGLIGGVNADDAEAQQRAAAPPRTQGRAGSDYLRAAPPGGPQPLPAR